MLRQSLAAGLAHSTRASPAHRLNTAIRRASSAHGAGAGGGGGGGKALLGVGVAGMAIVGGTVGYAGVDRDFRKMVEDTIPGSDTVMTMVHGEPEPEKKAPPKKPVLPPSTSTPPSKKRPVVVPESALPLLPEPPIEKPTFIKEQKAKEPEKAPVEEAPKPKEEQPKKVVEEVKKPEPVKEEPPKKKSEAPKKQEKVEEAEEVVLEEPPKKPVKKSPKKVSAPVEDDDETTILAGKDLHRRVVQVREELEAEMRAQLKRQAEAHADHIADALDVQKKELQRQYMRKLDETLEDMYLAYRNEMAGVMGKMRGLETSLGHRAFMDAAALEAQELWLACSALQLAVESPGTHMIPVGEKCQFVAGYEPSGKPVRNINREVTAIKKVLANYSQDPFVNAVLGSIPEVAFRRGVATPESIKERFLKVEEMAKRTALIGEEGGSLFQYFLSFVQSKLIVSPPSLKELPDKHTATDVDALGTHELVWLARGCVDRGDLEQAVKYVSLLKGEPGNVSQDWLKEARLLLETRQASRALMAHAAAVGVEALPVHRKH